MIEKFNAETPPETSETAEKTYNFIHLRDAKYYLPGVNPIPGNTSVYVRISLESVHGFSFGKLNIEYHYCPVIDFKESDNLLKHNK